MPVSWFCTECEREYQARPIRCECGAKLAGPDRRGVVRVEIEEDDGEVSFDVDVEE